MELHLKIIGYILVVLGLIHISFPKYFDWRKDLASISLINRQMMYVHTFFIGFIVLLIGLLCLYASKDILQTALGRLIALGLFLFWSVRLAIQFFGYSPKLWKGKRFETVMHIAFSVLWVYLTVVFFLIFWGG